MREQVSAVCGLPVAVARDFYDLVARAARYATFALRPTTQTEYWFCSALGSRERDKSVGGVMFLNVLLDLNKAARAEGVVQVRLSHVISKFILAVESVCADRTDKTCAVATFAFQGIVCNQSVTGES